MSEPVSLSAAAFDLAEWSGRKLAADPDHAVAQHVQALLGYLAGEQARVAQAFRAGAMYGLGRGAWDEADEYFALCGDAYADGRDIPERRRPSRTVASSTQKAG